MGGRSSEYFCCGIHCNVRRIRVSLLLPDVIIESVIVPMFCFFAFVFVLVFRIFLLLWMNYLINFARFVFYPVPGAW